MLHDKEFQEIQKLLKKILQKLRQQDNRPMTIEEAAEYLGLKKSYLYKLTSASVIGHYKSNGKKISFKRADLNKYVFANKVKTPEDVLRAIKVANGKTQKKG